MYPRIFLAILPALLGTFTPSLALPVLSSDTLSIDARSFDLSSDTTPLVSRDIDTELLVMRGFADLESDILLRAINEDLFPRANGPKRTATEAKQRKEGVRAQVSTNQAINAAKKVDLQAKAKLERPYGKPRKPKYTKNPETGHITGGYRQAGRAKAPGEPGYRLPKQPKTPKPDFAKGEHKTNAKAVKKQAEAKVRLEAKKKAGRDAHALANTRYAQTVAHGNLPNRHDEYNVLNHGILHGKDVRTGAYNLGKHDGENGRYPVTFRNGMQGAADKRHQPLPNMIGTGHEYPINNAKHGYHPDHEDQGPVRAIYQNNPAGGYNVQGVVSHDVTLPETHKGYNDHNQVEGKPAPVNDIQEGAGDTFFP